MKKKIITVFTFLVMATGAFAQTTLTRESARVPGMISSVAGSIRIPSSIRVNRDFDVTVTTNGNGCVEQGDTSVVMSDRSADVFVYDLTSATQPGTMCTMIFKEFKHTATLRFEKRRRAVIRIWVRQQSGTSPMGRPVLIERFVRVR